MFSSHKEADCRLCEFDLFKCQDKDIVSFKSALSLTLLQSIKA